MVSLFIRVIFVLILLIPGCYTAYAQGKSFGLGISTELRLQSRQYRLCIVPGINFNTGRNQFQLGPTISNTDVQLKTSYALDGISWSYLYRLSNSGSTTFHLGVQLLAQRRTESWNRNYWNGAEYIDQVAKSSETSKSALLKGSLQHVINKRIKAAVTLAGGIYSASWEDLSESDEFYNYVPYDESGLTYRGDFSIHYTLINLK